MTRRRAAVVDAPAVYARRMRVLVTGTSSGIGRATAEALVRDGHDVVATTRVHGSAPMGCSEIVGDLREESTISRLRVTGPFDALVSNAGITNFCALEDMSDDELNSVFETNLLVPLRLARLVLPDMRARGGGALVFVSSQSAYLPTPFVAAYSASKAGLEIAVESLAGEVRPFGVRTTLVLPGATSTGMAANAIRDVPPDSAYREAALATGERCDGVVNGGVDPDVVAAEVVRILAAASPPMRVVVGEATVANISRFRPVDRRFLDGV